MKRFAAILLAFAFTPSDGLFVQTRGAKLQANVTASAALKAAVAKPLTETIDPILVRPTAGKGVDKVRFGIRAMNFYGADLKHHSFSLDSVMTMKWKDPRVLNLLPDGLDKLSMSWKNAEQLMWMPGIVISNRDIDKYEIISASVTVYRSGEVRRVERSNCRVMKKFELEGYPFDEQNLDIKLASSKYMADEVELVPDEKLSGVEEDIWGLYDFKGWTTKAYEASDGDLKKSRGTLEVRVVRSLAKYSQDHLMPTFIVLMISWAVFYFPFANPFITARLALSILALLQFTNLMVKSSKELPGSAPFNWNDLLNQQIQTLMFITIVLNILSEVCFHQFHNEALARGLNREGKFLMPFLSVINIVIILGGCKYHWMTLSRTIFVTKVVLFILLSAYAAYAFWDERQRQIENADNIFAELDEEDRLEEVSKETNQLAKANYTKHNYRARSSVC